MAPHNKLLVADQTGKPMIARVVDNVLSSNARPILVVTGHQAEQVEHALGGRPVRYVHAPDYARGPVGQPEGRHRRGAAGVRGGAGLPGRHAAGDRADDRPAARRCYDPEEGRLIVLPTFRGKQGNPMLWDRRFFPEILQITGDSGARFLVGKHAEAVAEVEMADDAVLRDFDTTELLATLPG